MKVLIVVDAQNDFTVQTGALPPYDQSVANSVLYNIRQTIEKYRSEGAQIIFTMDTHSPINEANQTREEKHLPIKHCILGTKGHEFNFYIKQVVQDEDIILRKNTFGSEKLGEVLIHWNTFNAPIDEIVLCGFDTDYCVISNAVIAANALSYANISVIKNACMGSSPEMHEKALAMMKHLFIEVI